MRILDLALYPAARLLRPLGLRARLALLAGLMLALGEAASGSPCHAATRFDLCLSRGEIANLLGLTIETVSRTLTRLEKDKVIRRTGPRGIELSDPPRLHALAD